MSDYALTKRAEADLFEVFLFGYEQFGARPAEIYAAELEHTFQLLADNAHMGREAEAIAPGVRRLGDGSARHYLGRSEGLFHGASRECCTVTYRKRHRHGANASDTLVLRV